MASLVSGDILRVLLVSTERDANAQIGKALASGAGQHRLYWVSQPDLAPGRVQDLLPHIILLDDNAIDRSSDNMVRQLSGMVPQGGVILLVRPDDLALARQAVLAGARGFVEKPAEPDALLAAIRQVLSQRAVEPAVKAGEVAGQVIAFCAPKGGTGRTTLAINTSIGLMQSTRQPVVLVDADYAAPAIDVALNLRDELNISELRPKMAQLDAELIESVLTRHESGLAVLLAPPPSGQGASLSWPQVQQVMVWLKRIFPWVVVDLGLPMDETAFAFLDSADLICMSTLPEMIGLRNTRLMFGQLLARGYPEDRVWLILNRRGLPAGVPQAELEKWLGRKIRYSIPNQQELATDTVNRGVPFVLSHKRSGVAKASLGLAQEIARVLAVEGEQGAPITASTSAVAWAPTERRRTVWKPAVAGVLAALVLLLTAWIAFPAVRRGLAGRFRVESAPTAQVVSAAPSGTAAAGVGEKPPASPSAAPQTGEPTASAAAGAGEGPQPQALALAATTAAPTRFAPAATSADTPGPTAAPTKLALTRTSAKPIAPVEMPTRTPRPTETTPPTLTPTPTETPSPTATPTFTPTPTPTARPRPRPSATSTVAAKAPAPVSPAQGDVVTGRVAFGWQGSGALPPGTAYEVVLWNLGEDPSAARGAAAPITGTQLTADLDALNSIGLLKPGDIFWAVLVVRTDPYSRLILPTADSGRLLVYQPPQGQGEESGAPAPPKP